MNWDDSMTLTEAARVGEKWLKDGIPTPSLVWALQRLTQHARASIPEHATLADGRAVRDMTAAEAGLSGDDKGALRARGGDGPW